MLTCINNIQFYVLLVRNEGKLSLLSVDNLPLNFYSIHGVLKNTVRFIMFSVSTNIYNKKTKGPTLMED
jgi:hypothetical protein